MKTNHLPGRSGFENPAKSLKRSKRQTVRVDEATIIAQLERSLRECQASARLPFPKQWPIHRAHSKLIDAAEHLFGQINGWSVANRDFRICDIGKRVGEFSVHDTSLLDHCIWYRAAGRCAAIVAQPYALPSNDNYARSAADQAGVALHIPPHPFASFHYPNGTRFYVFTQVGHEIVWLPEQINGWEGAR